VCCGRCAQASVNPKTDTVEELQSRRKNLHMGMCKLLMENLVNSVELKLAEITSSQDKVSTIKVQIAKDFKGLMQNHEKVKVDAFNDDENYQRLIAEAFDGKKYSLDKLCMYLKYADAAVDSSVLERMFNARLADFGCPATGITAFPWVEVVLERRFEIHLGKWDASLVSFQALDIVTDALKHNANIRSVEIFGTNLRFTYGWNTTDLKLERNNAVKAVPATVSLLLRNCGLLTSLDLR
jgi:hypothetical protein